MNGFRHSDGQMESECENDHESANDVTVLCNVPNTGKCVDNHGPNLGNIISFVFVQLIFVY